MAKKKRTVPPQAAPPPAERSGVTPERFARLVQMLHLLAAKPHTREMLTRRLKIDIRGFYRDLGLVRATGVGIDLADSRYHLVNRLEESLGMLPFPDPLLTLSEARLLAKGRTAAHKKLRELLERIRS